MQTKDEKNVCSENSGSVRERYRVGKNTARKALDPLRTVCSAVICFSLKLRLGDLLKAMQRAANEANANST